MTSRKNFSLHDKGNWTAEFFRPGTHDGTSALAALAALLISPIIYAGAWNSVDLAGETHAAVPAGNLTGYVFDSQGTQHVNYKGADGHVYELYWDGAWHSSDLTQASCSPQRVGQVFVCVYAPQSVGVPAGYAFNAQGTQHVNYRTSNGHIYELMWDGTWHYTDLTVQSGNAPLAAGDPRGYMFDAQGTQHVNYRGMDGHIYELMWDGNWHNFDITQHTGAPLAAGDPAGYVFNAQGTQHVNYRGYDAHIYELYWNGNWHWSDLTQQSGNSPAAAGDPRGYSFELQQTQHVNYRGYDGHIYELSWGGGWHNSDLTKQSGAPTAVGDPVGYVLVAQNTQHVIFQTNGLGDICELYWDGSWHYNDNLTGLGGAPTGTGLTAYAFNGQGTQHIIYHGNFLSDDVYELYWSAPPSSSIHSHADITFADGTPVGGYSDLVINQDGSAQMSGHLHDSGFPNYQCAMTWGIIDGTGTVYTFGAQGNLQGTEVIFSPNRDWDWNKAGWNGNIAARWQQFSAAQPYWRASCNLDLPSVLKDLLSAIGIVTTFTAVF